MLDDDAVGALALLEVSVEFDELKRRTGGSIVALDASEHDRLHALVVQQNLEGDLHSVEQDPIAVLVDLVLKN